MYGRNELEAQDQKLIEAVEMILTGENGEWREADSIYGFCAQLASARPKSRDLFRRQLENHLVSRLTRERKEYGMNIEQIPKRRPFAPWGKQRTALLGLMIVVLLIAGLVAFNPPARALAQELIAIVRGEVSQVVVTTFEDGVVVSTEIHETVGTDLVTLEEAQAQYSFPIRVPTYLPQGFSEIRFNTFYNNTVVMVVDSSGWPRKFFELYQGLDDHSYASDERLGEVVVAGKPAVWAQDLGTTFNEDGNPSPLAAFKLSWEQDGLYYTLRSSDLSQEEMIKIAESIE